MGDTEWSTVGCRLSWWSLPRVYLGRFADGQTERALPSDCAGDLAVDESGERFQKRYSDDRLGEHNTLLSRRRVRNALINRLSRETVGTKRGLQEAVEEPDSFHVRPLRRLKI